ncbi:DNA mismatch repair protein MutS [hydrothermal vent metagenome]|uniref:DNA mismatch repair protein MutS n=1 Tax=hydrothermal vent metagenome TaxID=652676 RepID=A0A3B0VID1_9ZZZZ
MEKVTPAMRQFLDIKAEHPDALLFFRMGDFYEMFFEDARVASDLLGIALTSRDKEKKIPMCGVPFHAAMGYCRKLVKEGYKVAICDQMEDAAEAKGVVRRAVTSIITPGTALDAELLDSRANNYIAALSFGHGKGGLACMDITTGEFRVTEGEGPSTLIEELERLAPSELVTTERCLEELRQATGDALLPVKNISIIADYDLQQKVARERLLKHFDVLSLDGFGLAALTEGVRAAGALLNYVKETQKAELSHIRQCTPYYGNKYLTLDHHTRRNLEIIENTRSLERKGSLLGHLDKTLTPMGARRLRSWLIRPLLKVDEITARHGGVEELVKDRLLVSSLTSALSGVSDIERITGRVSVGIAGPRELISLKDSLFQVAPLKKTLRNLDSTLIKGLSDSLDEVAEVTALIENALREDPPHTTREGGFIKEGYNLELDELRGTAGLGKDWLKDLELKERKRTGIHTLKVKYNKVFGYYIEVSRAKSSEVPDEYIRKQTLVNAERFITPELKEWEVRLLSAEDKARALELALYAGVLTEVRLQTERLQATADIIATLDALLSFAVVSAGMDYVRPTINDGDRIEIKEGRHPVIEKASREPFTPNDLLIDCKTSQIILLTGPNMAGKSTYIRQVALIVLMAQAGCFVPAAKATIGVVDRIFTRVGASDDISRGQSTFMVEMAETANILNNATAKSLIILDEIGRGTSTFDGLSIAWAVVEYLHDRPGAATKTLFATHYHELTELSLTKERVKNYNMTVKEFDDRIIFLRKIVPGGASSSYGIQVGRLAGLPEEVITRAKEVLANLESGELNETGLPRIAGSRKGPSTGSEQPLPGLYPSGARIQPQAARGPQPDKVRDALRATDIDSLTPLEALNVLGRIKEMIKD